jgi:hypothetical protein
MVYKGFILEKLKKGNIQLPENELNALFYINKNPLPKAAGFEREQRLRYWKTQHTLQPDRADYLLYLNRKMEESWIRRRSKASVIGIY